MCEAVFFIKNFDFVNVARAVGRFDAGFDFPARSHFMCILCCNCVSGFRYVQFTSSLVANHSFNHLLTKLDIPVLDLLIEDFIGNLLTLCMIPIWSF